MIFFPFRSGTLGGNLIQTLQGSKGSWVRSQELVPFKKVYMGAKETVPEKWSTRNQTFPWNLCWRRKLNTSASQRRNLPFGKRFHRSNNLSDLTTLKRRMKPRQWWAGPYLDHHCLTMALCLYLNLMSVSPRWTLVCVRERVTGQR